MSSMLLTFLPLATFFEHGSGKMRMSDNNFKRLGATQGGKTTFVTKPVKNEQIP